MSDNIVADNFMTLEQPEKRCACGGCQWCIKRNEEEGIYEKEDLSE